MQSTAQAPRGATPGMTEVVGLAGLVDLETAAAEEVVLWGDPITLDALGAARAGGP